MKDRSSSDAALHIEDLYKSYGPKVVLENVDLSTSPGTFCSVVGPSGCGKSTLFRMVLGEEMPTRGLIHIEGDRVTGPGTDRGIVYQRYSLYPHLTVLGNVALGHNLRTPLAERIRNRKSIREQAMVYLERVHLGQHAAKYPHELSGGMQQRVAIAQALIMQPRLLMMDEPFGALDPETRESMQLFILELWEEHKMTIFFVTHDMEEAVYLGTRVLVLSQHYTDDRGDDPSVQRGARFVADYELPSTAQSTKVKTSPAFLDLVQEIRRVGFSPEERRHVSEFNLRHPDSFQTLTPHEKKP